MYMEMFVLNIWVYIRLGMYVHECRRYTYTFPSVTFFSPIQWGVKEGIGKKGLKKEIYCVSFDMLIVGSQYE